VTTLQDVLTAAQTLEIMSKPLLESVYVTYYGVLCLKELQMLLVLYSIKLNWK
jgi:hypothetical protein